jgi:hypothetical protein
MCFIFFTIKIKIISSRAKHEIVVMLYEQVQLFIR